MNKEKYNELPTTIFKYFYEKHDLYFTPNGIWTWNLIDNRYRKSPIDAKRVDNLSWEDYPNDNFGRTHLLNTDIVVLDIDNEDTTIDNNRISIPSLGITDMPIGLYTQTSNIGSYHIFYRVNPKVRKNIGERTIINLKNSKIDLLQNYILFEGHQSPAYELHKGDILPLPPQLVDVITEYIKEKHLHKKRGHSLLLQSNPSRQYLIERQLSGDIKEGTKDYNSYIRSIIPKEFLPPRVKKLVIGKSFTLSYDLINKMLVKLTTTKELGFHEHVLPTLDYILVQFGINPSSYETEKRLKQMLPSLPQHNPIPTYHWYDDNRDFVDMVRDQPSNTGVFRTMHKMKLYFISVHKTSLEPLVYGDNEYYFDKQIAEAIAPEYKAVKEDGTRGAFIVDDIPLVETFSDPYREEIEYNTTNELYRVNLSRPSKYVKEAEPIELDHSNNFLMNIMRSTVHPDYLDLMLNWHAQIVFGKVPPLMVPWIATGSNVLGGTGKSYVTITILDKILAGQSTVAKLKDIKDGWDIKTGMRLISFDEGDSTNQNEWLTLHNYLKISSGGNREITNAKYGNLANKVQLVAQSGASNTIPPLPESDRRILCLEPAHIEGLTEPITRHEQTKANEFERNFEKYDDELQEYTNHLCFLARKGLSEDIAMALFSVAPATPYRRQWLMDATTNSQVLLMALDDPDKLWSYIHWNRLEGRNIWMVTLLSYLVHQYYPKIGKVALCWEWFKEMLLLVQKQEDNDKTKAEVIKALGNKVHFKQTSGWAKERHDSFMADSHLGWHSQLELLVISDESIARYKELMDEIPE